jgi:hypothetical protein
VHGLSGQAWAPGRHAFVRAPEELLDHVEGLARRGLEWGSLKVVEAMSRAVKTYPIGIEAPVQDGKWRQQTKKAERKKPLSLTDSWSGHMI